MVRPMGTVKPMGIVMVTLKVKPMVTLKEMQTETPTPMVR
jgi:hypothetical protein